MSKLGYILKCSDELATECRGAFDDDYDMYLAYLDSLRVTCNGEPCRIIPFSRDEYMALVIVK